MTIVTPCHSQASHVGVDDGWAPPPPSPASCSLKAPSVFRDVRLVLALGANAPFAWLRGRPCHTRSKARTRVSAQRERAGVVASRVPAV